MTELLSELSQALVKTVEAAGAGVVRVETRRRLPASGIVWSPDGVVVTANHIVERDDDLRVGLADGRTVPARLAGGAVLRLNQYVALAADYARLLGGDTTAAWSVGLHVQIPGSPHTFALEMSNVASNTYQGSSRGLKTNGLNRLYGFEFTIPFHLRRFGAWFGRSGTAGVALGESGPAAASIQVSALSFPGDTTRITVGQIVRWINRDPLDHTISFEAEGPPSGPLPSKGSYAVKFDRPGTYPYHCTPHPFMRGVVVVR